VRTLIGLVQTRKTRCNGSVCVCVCVCAVATSGVFGGSGCGSFEIDDHVYSTNSTLRRVLAPWKACKHTYTNTHKTHLFGSKK
jgi:hypothetical protein